MCGVLLDERSKKQNKTKQWAQTTTQNMNQKQQIKFLLPFLFLLHRSKRAIPADMYCGTRNVVTLYTHHTECHCKPGFQKRFCEQGINLPFSSHFFKERVVDSYLTFILRQELQNLIVIEKLFFGRARGSSKNSIHLGC